MAATTAVATSQGADRIGEISALADGYSAAFLGAAGIAVVGALLAALLLRVKQPASVAQDRRCARSARSRPNPPRSSKGASVATARPWPPCLWGANPPDVGQCCLVF